MHVFIIETAFRRHVYRQRLYAASTLDQACQLAINDNDRRFERRHNDLGQIYVSAAWAGPHMGYLGRALWVPPQFDDVVNRKAYALDELLTLLKQRAAPDDAAAQTAIINAEILTATYAAR